MEQELKAIEAGVKGFNEKAAQLESGLNNVNDAIKVMRDEADKNQKALDTLVASQNNISKSFESKKSFNQVFAEQVKEEWADLSKSLSRGGGRYKMELKAVGNMTIATNLTGDSVVNYGTNAILPSQMPNFRDLIRTSNSSKIGRAHV